MKNELQNYALFIKIMKLSLSQMFILLIMTGVSAAGVSVTNAQEILDTRITIAVENKPLRDVLKTIEGEVDVKFAYSREAIGAIDGITIRATDEKLSDVLNKVLKHHAINYQVIGEQIILFQRVHQGDGLLESKDQMQYGVLEEIISGTVTSESGESIPGVNIILKGSTTGTVTDMDGNFSLLVPDLDGILVFSYIGYKTIDVPINGRSKIDVTLEEDVQRFEEVIIVGYGSQKKSDVTGAVSSVTSKDLREVAVANVSQALQGRAAGLDVVASGNREPGSAPQLRVRGNRSINAGNEPLIVLDGLPFSGNINDINPSDIESVEILKDASSASIYGSRGANGIILITTKRGAAGKTEITYDSYIGVNMPDVSEDYIMSGEEYYHFKREAERSEDNAGDGIDVVDDNNIFEPLELQSIEREVDTDWMDLILNNGILQNHQLGMYGGSEMTKFAVTFSYYDEQGALHGSSFKRLGFRINLDHQVNNWLKIGTSTFISQSKQDIADSPSVLTQAMLGSPLYPAYDDEGNMVEQLQITYRNPLLNTVEGAHVAENRSTRVFPALYGEVSLLKGLQYRLNVGPNIDYDRRGQFDGPKSVGRFGQTSRSIYNTSNETSYTIENLLMYKKSVGKSSFDFTGLYSVQSERRESSSLSAVDQPYQSSLFYNLGTSPSVSNYDSDLSEWSIISYMGRLRYTFNDRYLFTATLRTDGSSVLAKGNKWDYFPSFAFAWRAIEEGFLRDQDLISNLKVRLSYGEIGNAAIAPYQTRGGLSQSKYVFDNSTAFGFVPSGIANPDLSWEKSRTFNLGIDFGFFKERLSGSVEFYQTQTSDLILNRQLSQTSGFSSVLENVGVTQNSGVELTLSSRNVESGSFRWSTNLNFFANNEKILELYNGKVDDIGNQWFIGHPINVFYGYEKVGIWQLDEADEASEYGVEPGDIKLNDLNDDGKITGEFDRKILGNTVPDWSGGMTNRFEYGNLDFSFFFYARIGQMIRYRTWQATAQYNTLKVDYWTPENPTNSYPRPGSVPESSALNYYDGSFVKLRNVTLGYNLPNALLDRIGVTRLRVYATAQNPLVFTDFTFTDPELAGGNASGEGLLPAQRTILFGLNLGF